MIAAMTTSEHPPPRPRQLRLIIETDDFAEALRFYRDLLGMPEQPAFAGSGEDRVAILHAGLATVEIATPTHVVEIDRVEGAPPTPGPTLRLAVEVDDTEATAARLTEAGEEMVAPPVRTPFRSLNARFRGPAGWQVTLFQELETLEERRSRPGFATDDDRD